MVECLLHFQRAMMYQVTGKISLSDEFTSARHCTVLWQTFLCLSVSVWRFTNGNKKNIPSSILPQRTGVMSRLALHTKQWLFSTTTLDSVFLAEQLSDLVSDFLLIIHKKRLKLYG
jgi:hypothetical protein